mmetsp:Transcript_15058/g.23748  ORF Transcript_15058/g.23748 Transcript_15058/m.23748 type:complete len:173 (-) Transcript_15058:145-663(-)
MGVFKHVLKATSCFFFLACFLCLYGSYQRASFYVQGVVGVTAAHIFLYYAFMTGNSAARQQVMEEHAEKEEHFNRYRTYDKRMFVWERSFVNLYEQMVPFFAALWLHAVFGGNFQQTTYCGIAYVAIRSLYPLVYGGMNGIKTGSIFLVTLPNYLIIWGLVMCTLSSFWDLV